MDGREDRAEADRSAEVTRLKKQVDIAFENRMRNPRLTIRLAGNAYQILTRLDEAPAAAEASRVAGVGYFYLHDYNQAIKHYVIAQDYYQSVGDSKNLARILINIGRLYSSTDPSKSLKYYYQALPIIEKAADTASLAGLYLNMATVYTGNSGLKKALFLFNKSESLFRYLDDTVHQVMSLQNAAALYYKLGNVTEAKRRLRLAIDHSKKMKLHSIAASSQIQLALLYLESGDIRQSRKLLDSVEKLSLTLQTPDLEYDSKYLNYRLAARSGDLSGALNSLTEVYKVDSAAISERESADIASILRYYYQQNELQEKQLIITQQRYEAARFGWISATVVAILVSLIALAIGFHFVVLKRRRAADLAVKKQVNLLEQKALQAMMNPHFVFNVMNSIQYFMNESDNKSANQILAGFGRLTRKHLEICLQSTIVLQEEIVYLELYLSLEKVRFSGLSYKIFIDEDLDLDEISIPSMLVQPFVENAIWHGIMPHDGIGKLELSFRQSEEILEISIVDDGIGINNSLKNLKPSHISRGIALIRERIELWNKLNKQPILIMQAQNGNSGTIVTIQIPI